MGRKLTEDTPQLSGSGLTSVNSHAREDSTSDTVNNSTYDQGKKQEAQNVSDIQTSSSSSVEGLEVAIGSPTPSTNTNNAELSQSFPFTLPLDARGGYLKQSFSSLAIGGESSGGWQESWAKNTEPLNQEKSESVVQSPEIQSDTDDAKALIVKVRNSVWPYITSYKFEVSLKAASTSESARIPYLSINVNDPQKVGDAMRPYILYTVHTKVRYFSITSEPHVLNVPTSCYRQVSLILRNHRFPSSDATRISCGSTRRYP